MKSISNLRKLSQKKASQSTASSQENDVQVKDINGSENNTEKELKKKRKAIDLESTKANHIDNNSSFREITSSKKKPDTDLPSNENAYVLKVLYCFFLIV
jgi:hypothetical protein